MAFRDGGQIHVKMDMVNYGRVEGWIKFGQIVTACALVGR